jgi:hypothetical protein
MHRHSNFESSWKLDFKLTWLLKNGFAFGVMVLILFCKQGNMRCLAFLMLTGCHKTRKIGRRTWPTTPRCAIERRDISI